MVRREEPGVWEIFVPNARPGSCYKFLVTTGLGRRQVLKADPLAFRSELRPQTGSVVAAPTAHVWGDSEWMAGREKHHRPGRPMVIYEAHLGSWKRDHPAPESPGSSPGAADQAPGEWKTYRQLAEELVPYMCDLGYTHIELLPVTEHPFDGSWGYQTTGYFAPTSRFGTPDDFRAFVDAAHQAGIGIILDWVPAHFPRDAHGLAFFDGTSLYEHTDPRRRVHPDWHTFIFDYGRPEVVSFLISSACYWLEEFHLDGLRVDAVASMLYRDYSRHPQEWTPNVDGGREDLEAVAFVRRLNQTVHREYPGVLMIAEESTSWPGVTAAVEEGGLGFDIKWNMGWMNDTLAYFRTDPLGRGANQDKLTFSLMYAFNERYLLPLSHDEVVHGKASLLSKMPGSREQRFANLRALFGYMAAHPGRQLLFMGGEIGQWKEWNHDRELDWDLLQHKEHRQFQDYVRELNAFYASRRELWEQDDTWDGFEWIDITDRDRSVVTFLRKARAAKRFLLVVANFTPVLWDNYRVGVPEAKAYRPMFNGDETRFGGTGHRLPREIRVEAEPRHDREHSIVLDVPPLTVLFLRPVSPVSASASVTKPPKAR
jgi:1,4-alpha-glucan branching enzyme